MTRPCPVAISQGHGGADEAHRRHHVDVVDLVDFRVVGLDDAFRDQDARIGHHGIDAPEARHGCRDPGLLAFPVTGVVSLDQGGLATGRQAHRGRRPHPEAETPAARCQMARDGGADAAAGAGDHDDPAGTRAAHGPGSPRPRRISPHCPASYRDILIAEPFTETRQARLQVDAKVLQGRRLHNEVIVSANGRFPTLRPSSG